MNVLNTFKQFLNESFFNSNSDRELWIKLNAERQILFDKNCYDKTGKPYVNAISPRTMEQALQISRRQLEYDEKNGKLRYTLEELLLLDYEELKSISDKKHKEICDKLSHKRW
jgi:hypothetical protein